MATDVRGEARDGVVRWFQRDAPDRPAVIEAQLDGDAHTVMTLAEHRRADLVREKLTLLTRRLKRHPDDEGALRELVDRLHDGRPNTITSWHRTNTAHDGATPFAARGGNVVHHQSAPPQSTNGGAAHR